MGWEERNGQRYYYRKQRVGERVFSEYVGSGFLGELAALTDRQEQERKERRRKAFQREKALIDALHNQVELIGDLTRTALAASLHQAGYRRHKGQWRRQRG